MPIIWMRPRLTVICPRTAQILRELMVFTTFSLPSIPHLLTLVTGPHHLPKQPAHPQMGHAPSVLAPGATSAVGSMTFILQLSDLNWEAKVTQ